MLISFLAILAFAQGAAAGTPSIKTITQYVLPEKREIRSDEDLPGRRSPGTVVYKGILYVAGGHVAKDYAHHFYSETFLNTFQAYDLEKNTWKELAPKPYAGRFSSLVGYGDYIYSFGGFYGATPRGFELKEEDQISYDFIDRYDLKTGKWSTLSEKLPHARSQHSVVELNGKVYLIGGWDSAKHPSSSKENHQKAFIRTIDVFDLATERFEKPQYELPESGRRAHSAVVLDQKIIVSGGFGELKDSSLKSVIALDVKAGKWDVLTSLPTNMIFPLMVIIDNQLTLLGGTAFGPQLTHALVLPNGSQEWVKTDLPCGNLYERTVVRAGSSEWLLAGGRTRDGVLSPLIDRVR